MTLATTTNKVTYTGNGVTTSFPFAFPVLELGHLIVVLTEGGVDTELNPGQFSVTGIGSESGGEVTYPLSGSPISSSVRLTVLRRLPLTQETDLTNQSTLYPETIEQTFDRMVMLAQQNAEKLTRALVFSIADNFAEIVLPSASARAGKYLTFDVDGKPSVTSQVDLGALTVSSFWETTLALANAALARTALGIGATGTVGQAGADTILGNPTGATANPTYNSLVSYLARMGDTRGSVIRRGPSGWDVLGLGAAGTFLGSNGNDLTHVTPPVGEGQFKNLAITATTDTAVTVTADWVTLKDSNNNIKLIRAVSATVNTGATGLNGLDTGSPANNTWYSVWIIHNPTTNVTGTILSTHATSPTFPSGFTFRHRFGWVRTQSGSGALRRTRQRGEEAQYIVTGSVAAPTLSAGTITVVGDHVPVTAVMINVFAGITAWSSQAYVASNSSINSTRSQVWHWSGSNSVGNNQDLGCSTAWFVLESDSVIVGLTSTGFAGVYGWKDSI